MEYVSRIAEQKLLALARQFRAVAIIGPRQSGKTTLARRLFADKAYVSLENPDQLRFALEDPRGFLAQYTEGAILDEVQRAPELLSYLQQHLDEDARKGRFILTGSNNFLLTEKIAQTLAGRAAYLDLLPFSLAERPKGSSLEMLMFQGGYPAVCLGDASASDWFSAYVRTYVERDVRQLKNIDNLLAFDKMLRLCAGRIGQLVNYSNLAVEVGVDHKTIQSWLGILQASYVIFLLPPYHANFNERVVKTPKLYFYDTGLASFLLQIPSPAALIQHAYRGALFENFILTELLKNRYHTGLRSNLYFWRSADGHEVDVVIDRGDRTWPIEIKSGQTFHPDFLKNIRYWEQLTGQPGGTVFYAGEPAQRRSDGVSVLPYSEVVGW